MKPARLRDAAHDDIERAFQYYLLEAPHMVQAFVDAFNVARKHIEQHPGTGSLRYADVTDLPGLRFWSFSRFPYLMLYQERDTWLDVLRVLHQASDIPAHLEH